MKKYWPQAAMLLIGVGVLIDILAGFRHLVPSKYLDFYSQWLPYWTFMRTEYRRLEFPLWCHNLLSGFPLAHFPHAAVFYPLNVIFYWFDFEAGIARFYLAHFWLLGMFTYGCARETGASRPASFLAGVSLPLSGVFIGHLTASHDNNTIVWVTGGLWFALRYLNRERLLDLLGLAAATGLAALAGNYEVIIFSDAAFAVFLYLARRPRLRVVGGLLAAMVLGLFFGAPQFLNTAGFLSQSYRHFHELQAGDRGILNPTDRINLLMILFNFLVFWPNIPPEGAYYYYLGFVSLLGLFFMPPGRERRALVIVAVGTFLLLANVPPLNYLLQAFPVLGFSAPDMHYRMLFGVVILGIIFSSRGLDLILASDSPFPTRKFLIFVGVFFGYQAAWIGLGVAKAGWFFPMFSARVFFLAVLALVSGWVLYRRPAEPFAGKRQLLLPVLLLLDLFIFGFQAVDRSDKSFLQPPANPAWTEPEAALDRVHLISPLSQDLKLWQMVRLNRGPGYITGFIRNGINDYDEIVTSLRPARDLFSPVIITPRNQQLLDYLGVKYLFVLGASIPGSNPFSLLSRDLQANYSGPGPALTRPLISQETVSLTAGWRWRLKLYLFPGDALCFDLDGRLPALEISLIEGHSVLPAEPGRAEKSGYCQGLPLSAPGERMLEIRVPESAGEQRLFRPRIIGPRRPFQQVGGDNGPIQAYENDGALARYSLYYQYRVLSRDQTLAALFDGRFDPRASLLCTREDLGAQTLPASTLLRLDGVKKLEYRQSEVVLESDSPAPALLSAAEVYYPGWHAWVDGKETRIIRVNHAFQAVPVPAGRHRVVLRFEPREFRVGLGLMLASLLSAAVAVAVHLTGARFALPEGGKG